MKTKIYAIKNIRSESINNIWLAKNDKEASYLYAITMNKEKQQNPYFVENDFTLTCLGVVYTDIEDREEGIGIDYKVSKDFPYTLNEIPYNFEIPHESPSTDNSTVYDKQEQEKIQREIKESLAKE